MQCYAPATGKRGRQPTFSDAAIQLCLPEHQMSAWFGLAPKPGNGRKPIGPSRFGLEGSGLQHRLPPPEEVKRQTALPTQHDGTGPAGLPTIRASNREEVKQLPPTQFGGNENELLQTTGRTGHGQDV